MKMTQATPSQLGDEVIQPSQPAVDVHSSDGLHSSEDDEQEQVRLPLKNAQVSWRLNNDSVRHEDMIREIQSKEQAMAAELNSNSK